MEKFCLCSINQDSEDGRSSIPDEGVLACLLFRKREEYSMLEAEQYLKLIREDSFLSAMLVSYEMAATMALGKRILDYGCGYGWGSYILAECGGIVTGYDLNRERVEFARTIFARECVEFISERDSLGNGQYDMICLFMVLQYLKKEVKWEILTYVSMRVKPGGMLCISYKKSGEKSLKFVLDQWERENDFLLTEVYERYLSDADYIIECHYTRN